MLARDLQGLRVAELYRLFVLRAGAPAGAGGPLLLAAERLLVRLEAELDVPLQALLDAGAGGVTSRSPSEQGETRAAPGSAP
jgi:hypothetical protein